MTLQEALQTLQSLGNESVRARNAKNGAGDNQFGVPLGEVRKVAKQIKRDDALALALWESGNVDARLCAILLFKPKSLSTDDVGKMVRDATFAPIG